MNTPEPNGLPRRMKALRAHARGGPEQLHYEDAPTPQAPSGSDVLVRVRAAAITFDELTWPGTWETDGVDRTPVIPSHEFAGVVAAVGPNVNRLAIGDAVFGLVPFDRDGAAAEYVLVPAANLAVKPEKVPDVVAAAAALPALTAWEALSQHAHVTAGQRLLVRGGTGAVGSFLVQSAHRLGVEVTATVRSAASVERVQRLGADEVLVADEPEAITPATFDASIDAVGADTPQWLYRAVRPSGHVITLQEEPDSALAESLGVDAAFFEVTLRTEPLEELATLLAGGGIEVAIAQTYPLAEGRRAYTDRGRKGAQGKSVLTVAP